MNAGRLGRDVKAVKPPGHKRGLVVETSDIEKGPLVGKATVNTRSTNHTWLQKLWGNGWK